VKKQNSYVIGADILGVTITRDASNVFQAPMTDSQFKDYQKQMDAFRARDIKYNISRSSGAGAAAASSCGADGDLWQWLAFAIVFTVMFTVMLYLSSRRGLR
jgi:hypothetical protein